MTKNANDMQTDQTDDYDQLKEALLRHYKVTARELNARFNSANETYKMTSNHVQILCVHGRITIHFIYIYIYIYIFVMMRRHICHCIIISFVVNEIKFSSRQQLCYE